MTDAWDAASRGGTGGEAPVRPLVTVITPTIEGRFDLLHEAMDSVRRQTLAGVEHAILLDTHNDGPARLRNAMLDACHTPYVAFLDDDDLFDPDHLESLLRALEEDDASVAYSYCRVEPAGALVVPRPSDSRQVWRLMNAGRNVIPVTVLAKRSAILAGQGFWAADRYEDYSLWMRLKTLGHSFARLERETWTYRISPTGRTHS